MDIKLQTLPPYNVQFKRDTEIVTTWLAEAGKILRHLFKEHDSSTVTKFIPKTRDFVPMAKAIADSQDKGAGCDISQFIAPLDVIRSALRDAIKTRTMFLTIWARISKSKDNDGHATFIWDLEQVRDVLETVQAPPGADQNTEDVASKVGSLRLSRSNATSSNRYEGLTVSQTSDSGLEKTASPVSVSPEHQDDEQEPATEVQYEAKDNQSDLDTFILFASIHATATILRDYVASL